MTETDYQALRRILHSVVKLDDEDAWPDGMVTTLFDTGIRLSFLCGPTGRLNIVVIDQGLEVRQDRDQTIASD